MDKIMNNRQELYIAVAFTVIGLAAAISGLVTHWTVPVLVGLTAGFLPTGIGLLIAYRSTAADPEYKRKVAIKDEERNLFLRTKAGQSAFWLSYGVVFIIAMFSNVVTLRLGTFSIVTLLLMGAFYFGALAYFARRY